MIVVNLDVMMAKRKISSGELADRVGITPANLSILKNNKAKAIKFVKYLSVSQGIYWIIQNRGNYEKIKKECFILYNFICYIIIYIIFNIREV